MIWLYAYKKSEVYGPFDTTVNAHVYAHRHKIRGYMTLGNGDLRLLTQPHIKYISVSMTPNGYAPSAPGE